MDLLVVRFGPPATLRLLKDSELENYARSLGFEEPENEQSNGFYDYMRRPQGEVVGVRWSPFTYAEYVLQRVPETANITLVPNGQLTSIRIWFEEPTDFDESISDDQEFCSNRIFLNKSTGDTIVTFAIPAEVNETHFRSIVS